MVRRTVKKGFTLVEILIVVVILGILAAIVIPQFTSASESAKSSSLTSQLQTIRSQIELYKIQHNDDAPPLVADTNWDKMTGLTDIDGVEYANAAAVPAGTTAYGPYLQQPPVNPFTNGSDLAVDASADWMYDDSTGQIKAVVPADKWDELFELGLGTVADESLTENADVAQGS